jgi:hypothetical protein
MADETVTTPRPEGPSPWPAIDVPDWNTFNDIVRRLDFALPPMLPMLFRGQPNAHWKLTPSLARELRGLTAEVAFQIETELLSQFKASIPIPIDRELPRRGPVDWWTRMRHYGAPTRLLDWTESPYVAAYAAVRELSATPGAVWCLSSLQLERTLEDRGAPPFATASPELEWLLERHAQEPFCYLFGLKEGRSDRMVAQRAAFTLSTAILADHDDLVPPRAKDRAEACLKLVIPAEQKLPFLRELYRLNITAATVFPGLDGIGRAIAELAALRRAEILSGQPLHGAAPTPTIPAPA